jgi:2,4-dienoyl-CoA reductase-like NADH-dependent reductase (Old Yellow Enzyme family)
MGSLEAPPRYQSDITDARRLGEPVTFAFSGRTAPNLFMKAAMTEQLSSWHKEEPQKRGIPTANLCRVYERWGRGGIGMVVTGNVSKWINANTGSDRRKTEPIAKSISVIFCDHLESVGDPVIPQDAPFEGKRFEAFKQWAHSVKKGGNLMVAQVSHPGRQCHSYFQPNPVAASAIPYDFSGPRRPLKFNDPHAASEEEIAAIVDSFAHAAEYLEKAGFDGMQLHAANGFLLSGFLSATTNKRTDRYGGHINNRMRIHLEIEQAIRRRVSSNFILGIKINSTEFQESAFTPEEANQVCLALERHRFDFVELSGGSSEKLMTGNQHRGEVVRESTKRREAYFQEFAEKIVPGLTKTKVYLTGGLRTVGGMIRALETVDGIGLARPLVQEFDFCKKVLDGEVTGSIIPKMELGEFWLALMAGNRAIREVGQGKEPLELWKDEVIQDLRRGYDLWIDNKSSDREYISYYGVTSTEAMEQGKMPPFNHGLSSERL